MEKYQPKIPHLLQLDHHTANHVALFIPSKPLCEFNPEVQTSGVSELDLNKVATVRQLAIIYAFYADKSGYDRQLDRSSSASSSWPSSDHHLRRLCRGVFEYVLRMLSKLQMAARSTFDTRFSTPRASTRSAKLKSTRKEVPEQRSCKSFGKT